MTISLLLMEKTVIMNPGDICIIAPDTYHEEMADTRSTAISVILKQDVFESAFFRMFSQKDLLALFLERSFMNRTGEPAACFFIRTKMMILREYSRTFSWNAILMTHIQMTA